jgi:hypothetical protein
MECEKLKVVEVVSRSLRCYRFRTQVSRSAIGGWKQTTKEVNEKPLVCYGCGVEACFCYCIRKRASLTVEQGGWVKATAVVKDMGTF